MKHFSSWYNILEAWYARYTKANQPSQANTRSGKADLPSQVKARGEKLTSQPEVLPSPIYLSIYAKVEEAGYAKVQNWLMVIFLINLI